MNNQNAGNDMILLVEDDRSLCKGISYALEKEGFCVNSAGNIKDAMREFETGRYELVLLDVMLPDGSGFDLCREIKEYSAVPIIFLTAFDEEVNVVMGLDSGADDYITKPFGLSELVSRVRAVLRRYKTSAKSTIGKGSIKLDTQAFKVYKRGREIILTAKEFKLLLFFIKNSGQLLSKDQILMAISDDDHAYYDDNTISVYIRRIREKIEDDPSNPLLIKTIRGMGYQWTD